MRIERPDIRSWLQMPVAILGAGISGKAAADLIESLGGSAVVYDEKNSDFPLTFEIVDARRHNLVVASPGFSPQHPWVCRARQAGCEVIGELDLACLLWKGRVIAVTGTNGKTTLVEFIAHSLKHAGIEAHAVGNIGFPFARLLQQNPSHDAWAVVEVSSFQAELIKYFWSDAVLWSNFSEDHLDRYTTMESYFSAKAGLLSAGSPKIAMVGPEVAHACAAFKQPLPPNVYVVDGQFIRIPEHSVFNLKPQRDNFKLAAMLFRYLGFDPDMLQDSARTFRQSPHRLARIATIRGVEFWNDSKATNFSAAEAAFKQFSKPVRWIGGGRTKGGEVDAFVLRISPRITKAYLTGDIADQLHTTLDTLQKPNQKVFSLEEAVLLAYEQSQPGDVVLLSPGFASQKPFRNYSERGNCFEKVVSDLKVNVSLTP